MSPLCSRNARPKEALVGRAQWGTRRAILDTYTSKLARIIFNHSLRPCLGKARLGAPGLGGCEVWTF